MIADYLPVILSSLAFIAFYSGIEIAYLSSNKFKIELDSKQGKWSGRILSFFSKSPSRFICTILVGLNISLVVYGTYMSELLRPWIMQWLPERFGTEPATLIMETVITTFFLLIAGEFLPKVLFSINPNETLTFFSGFLWLSYIILFPVVWLILKLSHFLLRHLFKVDFSEESTGFGRIDLDNFIGEISEKSGGKGEFNKEIQMFQNALDFDSLKLRQCMIPRNEIISMNVNDSVEALRKKFVETGLSKIMIYQGTRDNIIGFVHSYEMFKHPKDIMSVLLPVSIFPETLPARQLLSHFTANHRSAAIIVDEFGTTSGMVTVEDIMEEIFGEINDEHDVDELYEKKISDTEFLFAGRLEIDFLNKKYNLELPESDEYTTLSGLILFNLEDIPHLRQQLVVGSYHLTIEAVSGNKIEQVRLKIQNPD
ncbi:MAG TPA: hemolysin family protein [Bacteroidia bacterium]|nr:MAG: cbs domain containing protein [Bacteroidetes bacterium OLB10]MBE7510575.1 HlyC/CorC family transporter [Bacteroidia bacterium]MBX3106061.1 HlyC/CorC family transporter [Bacteroidota bacterium]MCE7956293.1 HlyC/CorC family transporter [Bacteroidetes bacterium CHB6]OQB62646.1 MAG: Hemolysin C [Bacteroidetes bacterium ADurb.Bin141]